MRTWVVAGIVTGCAVAAVADVTREDIEALIASEVHDWLWKFGEAPGAEAADFDDSDWQHVDLGFQWWPHDSTCWFRKGLAIPETVNGIATAGSVVRLKVGMDNEAKAYVNGEFKQQFTWSDGDFVLTENAQPGQVVTVALYAINRPGYGTLYQAYLVSDASEQMVGAVRALLADCDAAASDAPYVPADEAAHWEDSIQKSLTRLDMKAYRAADTKAFLASVERARAVLLADMETLTARLKRIGAKLLQLKQRIEMGKQRGFDLSYPRVDARVVESFVQYVRDDVAEGVTAHTLRGLKTATYIERVCGQALAATAAVFEDPSLDVPVPRYKTGPVGIRDGAFWQNDRPVFFTGVGHFGQVRRDIPILNEYGLNIVQFELGPRAALPDPNTVDTDVIRREVVQWLDLAAEHNVAVDLLVSPHYFPQWAWDSDPAHANCGSGFIKFCIEAPSTRQVMEKWLDTLMPLIADHPALHSICLSNEPHYKGRSKYEQQLFRQWLEEGYETTAAMSRAHGVHYTDFEKVEIPENASDYALFFDWCRFNQERFLEFHEMLRDLVHKHDPDLPVHAKTMSQAFDDPGQFEDGVDHEAFHQIGRIAGNDCWNPFYGEQRNPYKEGWLIMAINYALQRCVAPDCPIFNSEDHVIADGEKRYIPDEHIRTAFWHQAINGQGAATTWVWERGQTGDLAENILTRANCVRALGHVALDLNRLADEVHGLQQAKAEMAVFYSACSMLPSADHTAEAKAAFEGAYFTCAPCDIITERQVEAGKLKRYKIVVVPRATHVPQPVAGAFSAHIRDGGTVMTVGGGFTHDEYGQIRLRTPRATGEGRLVAYPDPLTPQAYRDILDRLLDETGCTRLVRIEGPHGEPIWGVNVRAVEYNGKLLVNLINFLRQPQEIALVGGKPDQKAVNLFDNSDVQFPLALAPLDPVLLAIDAPARN